MFSFKIFLGSVAFNLSICLVSSSILEFLVSFQIASALNSLSVVSEFKLLRNVLAVEQSETSKRVWSNFSNAGSENSAFSSLSTFFIQTANFSTIDSP